MLILKLFFKKIILMMKKYSDNLKRIGQILGLQGNYGDHKSWFIPIVSA